MFAWDLVITIGACLAQFPTFPLHNGTVLESIWTFEKNLAKPTCYVPTANNRESFGIDLDIWQKSGVKFSWCWMLTPDQEGIIWSNTCNLFQFLSILDNWRNSKIVHDYIIFSGCLTHVSISWATVQCWPQLATDTGRAGARPHPPQQEVGDTHRAPHLQTLTW